jgi:hypothetical protein
MLRPSAARTGLVLTLTLGLTGCQFLPGPTAGNPPPGATADTRPPQPSASEPAPSGASAGKPQWFYNPTPDANTLGGIGICGRHVRGPSGQREKAIQRAFDELAGQMGTKVDLSIEKTADNNGGTGSIYSFQTTEGKIVKARLRAQWIDPQTDELYLWMTVP